ncbi:MAG: helix-turn-helix transcriptional regulator [Chitinophagaceae bacterium]|nr:helix-turn-helix transcriptional regulator [Chitinophagaceae bacterium]
MEPEFNLPEHWAFKLAYTLPQEYRGRVLRGAKVITATGESGSIIIQTFEHPLFTIRFKFIELFRSIKIPFSHNKGRLVSFLAIKNNIHYKISGLGLLKLSAGQFSLLHCKAKSFVASYEKNIIYHSLEINWSPEIVKENAPFFQLLEPVLDPHRVNKHFFLGNRAHTANNKIIDVANEILKSPYDEANSALMFQHKAREYFFLICVAIGRIPAAGLHLTDEEWKKIEAIAERLRNQPDKKFPIAGLAAESQMNTTKLKDGFKDKFDSGMFEYQMAWRMKEAMRLLEETTMNPKEISAKIGYKGLSSFITKFREYYGYPPGKVIRKK